MPRKPKRSPDKIGQAKRYFYRWVFELDTYRMNLQLTEMITRSLECLYSHYDRMQNHEFLKEYRMIKARLLIYRIRYKIKKAVFVTEFAYFYNTFGTTQQFEKALAEVYPMSKLEMRFVASGLARRSKKPIQHIKTCERTGMLLYHGIEHEGMLFATNYDRDLWIEASSSSPTLPTEQKN